MGSPSPLVVAALGERGGWAGPPGLPLVWLSRYFQVCISIKLLKLPLCTELTLAAAKEQ